MPACHPLTPEAPAESPTCSLSELMHAIALTKPLMQRPNRPLACFSSGKKKMRP